MNEDILKPATRRRTQASDVRGDIGFSRRKPEQSDIDSFEDFKKLFPFRNTHMVNYVDQIKQISAGPLDSSFSVKEMAKCFQSPAWIDHWNDNSELIHLLQALPKRNRDQ